MRGFRARKEKERKKKIKVSKVTPKDITYLKLQYIT